VRQSCLTPATGQPAAPTTHISAGHPADLLRGIVASPPRAAPRGVAPPQPKTAVVRRVADGTATCQTELGAAWWCRSPHAAPAYRRCAAAAAPASARSRKTYPESIACAQPRVAERQLGMCQLEREKRKDGESGGERRTLSNNKVAKCCYYRRSYGSFSEAAKSCVWACSDVGRTVRGHNPTLAETRSRGAPAGAKPTRRC
jgi:hypothetical protein